jgi:hypothetical protein
MLVFLLIFALSVASPMPYLSILSTGIFHLLSSPCSYEVNDIA